jgi:hypothetical protein
MTAKEVIEIVKESNLWETLSPEERQQVIVHALDMTRIPINEENIRNNIGEVYLAL